MSSPPTITTTKLTYPPAHGAASIYGTHLPPPLFHLHTHPPSACDKAVPPDTYTALSTAIAPTKLIPYPFTPTAEDETLVLIDEILAAFGRLDVWICSSGLLGPASIHDTTPSIAQACLDAHALAPLFALKHAPPAMAKLLTEKRAYPNAAPKLQKYGSIVVVGSVAATYGGCWGPCYTMAAHAALGVVRAGVAVLKGTGVRINTISAGQIDVGDVNLHEMDGRGMTAQFPPSRLQEKEVS